MNLENQVLPEASLLRGSGRIFT